MTATLDPIRFTLRPYQDEAVARMESALARGSRRQLGVAATGLGKTVMFCGWAAQRGGRTLILAHRDELVSQAVQRVTEIWPGVPVGVVKAERNEVDAHVVVASVQTLARKRRMDQFLAAADGTLRSLPPLDLVVVDEAHHSAADSYRRIIAALRAGEPDGPILLGVTATPDRGDGKGLDDIYDEIVWNYDILWGIRSGFLADVRAKRIVLDEFNIGDVKVSRGDFEAGSAGKALSDADAPEHIVRAWQRHASDRQTIVFTPTVALAYEVRDQYRHRGIRAEMVSGETPLEDRRDVLHRYAIGEVQVVANCAVLTEGYDEPRTDCIIVARPTKSRALFTQMIGRGTRRHPDKEHLLVLDVVGASEMHSLITVPSLFGLEHDLAAAVGEQNLTDVVDEFERREVKAGRMLAEDAELFRRMRARGIAWVKVDHDGQRRYQRGLGRDDAGRARPTVVLVEQRADDEHSWLCGLHHFDGTKRVLIADVTLELAQSVGEDYARKKLGGRVALINTEAPWRGKPATLKQRKLARHIDLPDRETYKTAGELSDALDAHMTKRRNDAEKKAAENGAARAARDGVAGPAR